MNEEKGLPAGQLKSPNSPKRTKQHDTTTSTPAHGYSLRDEVLYNLLALPIALLLVIAGCLLLTLGWPS